MNADDKSPPRDWPEIDTTVASAARVYDYLLGGDVNFEVDRQLAHKANEGLPGGIDGARANRDFPGRAVRHLVRETGIRRPRRATSPGELPVMSDHTGARVTRWLANDMRALAELVDAADVAALADDEVSSARQHLLESLEAADRATNRAVDHNASQ